MIRSALYCEEELSDIADESPVRESVVADPRPLPARRKLDLDEIESKGHQDDDHEGTKRIKQ